MKDNRNNKKKDLKKRMRLDAFRAEERFDKEDEDNVLDDALEFLNLDDEMAEPYENGRDRVSSTVEASLAQDEEDEAYADVECVHEDADVEKEDDENEDVEIDEDENADVEKEDVEDTDAEIEEDGYRDVDYEDDDYEYEEEYDDYDEYEDEDYEYDDVGYQYDDEHGGIIVRFKRFLTEMSTLDMVVAMLGIVVFVGALMSGVLYANAKSIEKQVASFGSVGEEMEGISVIGEGGLVAVSESVKLAGMVDMEEEPEEVEEEEDDEKKAAIEVALNLTSIQSDLKIKFVNKETGKLIGGVPFEVEVSGGKKTLELKDEDKDGIIYQTEIAAGTYQVTVKPFKDGGYEEYKLPLAASVTVTDTIAYKKVDVADEIKSESEINAAKEDTAAQDMAVESVLTDTVEWVESTKTPIGGEQVVYEEVPKQNIPDPWTIGSAFVKLVEEGENRVSEEDKVGEQTPNVDGSEQGQGGSGEEGQEGGNGEDNSGSNGSQTPTQPESPKELKVSLDKDNLTLQVGQSGSLTLTVDGPEASRSWASSDDKVASVDSNGKVTAIAPGTATITATVTPAEGKAASASCTVTVTSLYAKVTISGANEVTVGQTITLTAQTEPQGGTITWSSDNSSVATVDGAGVVTGVAAGTANIKAACSDATDIAATYQITVKGAVDGSAKLKDKDGNQMYYIASGVYYEATYNDYNKYDKFYKKSSAVTGYRYTGWQTIDGSVYFFDKNGNYVTGEQVIQGAKYTFGSDGKLQSGSGSMGIDVSKWNGNIDWNAVKNSGVSYVIIRCGYRGSSTGVLVEDPQFRSNIKGAKAAGLKVGVYFFSQAVNEVEAVEEASMVLNLVSGYGLNYPIFLDVESSGGRGDGISRDTRTAVCKAFCATIQNSGYTAGIYANKTWLTSYINTGSLTGYKIWLAQYASAPSYTATKYDMWQYSSKGRVSGISGNVDMNISYMGY